MKIKGNLETRNVWIDGECLDPLPSQGVVNHSPDGFNWSYGGSGPSQLALAILLYHFPKTTALRWYQDFKWDIISGLPAGDFEIELDLDEWLEKADEKTKI